MLSIKVPPLGESIVEATVSRWLKKAGDQVTTGDTIVELETDKITVEVPAPRAGVLSAQAKAEGDVVKVDDILGEIDETAAVAGVAAASGSESGTASSESGGEQSSPAARSVPAESDAVSTNSGGEQSSPAARSVPAESGAASSQSDNVKSSPAARRAAAEAGIDIAGVPGTGRGGVVRTPDVAGYVAKEGASAPDGAAPDGVARESDRKQSAVPSSNGERETREKMSTRRKRIAENLLQSQHATAHLTTFNEIDMSAVNGIRERMKERIEKEQGVKLTLMPFFVKAACMALEGFPVVNAQIDGETIIYRHYVNMGIAVASDAGLVVPNIKDAHLKGMLDISRDIAAIAKRARDGKLAMDDLTGGTFTITNGGVFGSLVSTPIINYPQVAILGLHKTQERPVAVNGQVEIRPMMYIALSYDHRIVEGQQAVLFLVRVKELLEDPATMLIS